MALDSAFFLTFKGHIGPHKCVNGLWYARDVESSGITPQEFIEQWYDDVWVAEMQPLLSASFTLDSLKGHFYNNPGPATPAYTKIVNEVGGNADECLPAWNTVDIFKYPDMASGVPDTNIWEAGFVGFSGIPEIAQVDGYLTDTALASWQGVANALLTITLSESPNPEYTLGMYRFGPTAAYPDKPPAGRVICNNAIAAQKTGRRGSRWNG